MTRKTETSSFGVSARIGHNSSKFYNSKLYDKLNIKFEKSTQENIINNDKLDKIYHHSSESMQELPDNSVHLMVTSPPYNVSKDYDTNLSLNEYLELLRNVLSETYRVLINGGRACINIANVGRKVYKVSKF